MTTIPPELYPRSLANCARFDQLFHAWNAYDRALDGDRNRGERFRPMVHSFLPAVVLGSPVADAAQAREGRSNVRTLARQVVGHQLGYLRGVESLGARFWEIRPDAVEAWLGPREFGRCRYQRVVDQLTPSTPPESAVRHELLRPAPSVYERMAGAVATVVLGYKLQVPLGEPPQRQPYDQADLDALHVRHCDLTAAALYGSPKPLQEKLLAAAQDAKNPLPDPQEVHICSVSTALRRLDFTHGEEITSPARTGESALGSDAAIATLAL